MIDQIEFWHSRYVQQVNWTIATRRYIFNKIGAHPTQSIFEIGCGSGAVIKSFNKDGFNRVTGADNQYLVLNRSLGNLLNADAHSLPLRNRAFDISLCHFLLLWAADPLTAVKELARVTKPNGWVIALAEPDYGARIDFPDKLSKIGSAQSQALQKQGADVLIGRKLKNLFFKSGLKNICSGIIAAEWNKEFDQAEFDLEWSVIRRDIGLILSQNELDEYYEYDLDESRQGNRILYVPTFYAFGQVPA